jgi:hypothetical protein
MQIPIFRAKDKDSDKIVEGFYCNYPLLTNPNESDIMNNVVHSIFTYQNGMMGMINEPIACSIDITTLEFVKFIDVPCNTERIIL